MPCCRVSSGVTAVFAPPRRPRCSAEPRRWARCSPSILPCMPSRDVAKEEIRKTLDTVRHVVSNGTIAGISEADTRAHFIDPLIRSLGYKAFGDVQREVYTT